jgi:hypothetical protein
MKIKSAEKFMDKTIKILKNIVKWKDRKNIILKKTSIKY